MWDYDSKHDRSTMFEIRLDAIYNNHNISYIVI